VRDVHDGIVKKKTCLNYGRMRKVDKRFVKVGKLRFCTESGLSG